MSCWVSILTTYFFKLFNFHCSQYHCRNGKYNISFWNLRMCWHFENLKIFHCQECDHNADIPGRSLVPWYPHFSNDWWGSVDLKKKILAVPLFRLHSEEHLMGNLRRTACSGWFSLPLPSLFWFNFSSWKGVFGGPRNWGYLN